ncbi:MAG TPA: hypothetical protein VEB21_10040 [Terriglobales bacterium]|nr:hypothetical protein [Terriglobales bacterium]
MIDRTKNDAFFAKAESSLRDLFATARRKNELHFALSLGPEFRGSQDAGWNTAEDAMCAFDQYGEFLGTMASSPIKVRIALAYYCHLAEASGYYEIAKNMLRIASGELYNTRPFADLVRKSPSGAIVAPNANRVFQNLAGHARDIEMHELAEVFRDAFDGDIRNGYAHADYVVWTDGIRLRKRNGGQPRIVRYEEFNQWFARATEFFLILQRVISETLMLYSPAREIVGRLSDEPLQRWEIAYDPTTEGFSISSVDFV